MSLKNINFNTTKFFVSDLQFTTLMGKFKDYLKKFKFKFLKQLFKEIGANDILKFSASLAYYTILSLVPLLVIVLNVTGFLFGKDAITGELYAEINQMVGNNAAVQIQEAIQNIHLTQDSFFATAIGVVVLIFGATGIFGEMQDSLNKVWGLRTKSLKVWWRLIISRLVSFSIILSIGFVMIVSLILNALVKALSKHISNIFGGIGDTILAGLDNIIFIIISTLIFGIIFKVLPDALIRWKDVFMGALITALLFTLGKYLIGIYLGSSNLSNVYGAAGSTMILMIWIYYSSAILYIGAVFTKVYSNRFGAKIRPSEHSVWVKTEEIPVSETPIAPIDEDLKTKKM